MNMFTSLSFTKPASEIIEKMKDKVERLKAKIEERTKRIIDLRVEYGIDDAALIGLLQAARRDQMNANASRSYSYMGATGAPMMLASLFNNAGAPVGPVGGVTHESRVVGAGVVQNLMTEQDAIESERDQIGTLEMTIRNLKPIPRYSADGVMLPEQEFPLSREELKYLGF